MTQPADEIPFQLDPRLAGDTFCVGELELSRVLLMDELRFPWLILVPRRAGLTELIELDRADQHTLLDEINRAAHVLHAMTNPDKLNIAALGNVVAQLHVHLIARYRGDAAWPRPVWGVGDRVAYAAEERDRVLGLLRSGLALVAIE